MASLFCSSQAKSLLQIRCYTNLHDESRGASDHELIVRAADEGRILITNDKDFGEKVFREGYPHRGVILLRLDDERAAHKIEILGRLLNGYSERLMERYVVVTETQARFVGGNPLSEPNTD